MRSDMALCDKVNMQTVSVHGNPVNDFWLLVAWIFLKACSLY